MKHGPGVLGARHATTSWPETTAAAEHGLLQVHDPEVAEELVARTFLPVQVMPPPARREFRMDLIDVKMPRMTAAVVSFGTGVRIVSAPAEQVHLNLTLRGRAVWRGHGTDPHLTSRGMGVVFNPGQAADTLWSSNCAHLCLMVSRESLESEIEALTGRSVRSRLVFAPRLAPEGTTTARLLTPALQLLASQLHPHRSELLFAAIGRHLEGLVLDGLLLDHPHNHSALLLGQPGPARRTPVARAVELLEEHPEHPWTTVGLAQQVHLSVRALQEGFRREHQVTPMGYLRRTRLRRAHHALVAAPPGSLKVQEVALRFGFLHLGRFSATYRHEYGEHPSTTLARHP